MLNINLINKTISNLDHVEIFRLYKAMEWSMSPTIIKILEEKVSKETITIKVGNNILYLCNCGNKMGHTWGNYLVHCYKCSEYICNDCKSPCIQCGRDYCQKCIKRCVKKCDKPICQICKEVIVDALGEDECIHI